MAICLANNPKILIFCYITALKSNLAYKFWSDSLWEIVLTTEAMSHFQIHVMIKLRTTLRHKFNSLKGICL